MPLPEGNPRIPEGINASSDNPLKEFTALVVGVGGAIVGAVFLISVSAHFLAPYIPFSWELPSVEVAAAEGPEADTRRQQALKQLGRALLDSSLGVPIDGKPAAERVPPEYFHFRLIDSPVPNAYATLGANIGVFTGALDEVESENGLAMVLAHEIAHVQLRHPIEAVGRGVVVQIALAAVLGSDAPLGGGLGTGSTLTVLSFNRDMELAADRRALEILRAHYGHLAGADEFFNNMQADENVDAWLEFASTHPATERRLQLIHEAMREDKEDAETTPLPDALKVAAD